MLYGRRSIIFYLHQSCIFYPTGKNARLKRHHSLFPAPCPLFLTRYPRYWLRLMDLYEILHGAGDVVNRRTLKPLLRDNILHDAVYAF